jgi:hypothetical protein
LKSDWNETIIFNGSGVDPETGKSMKRKYAFAVATMIVIGVVLMVTLMQVRSVRSGPQASTPTPTYGVNPNATIVLPLMPTAIQPTIVDLAPNIPYEDKPSVVVQHADGSRERYLLAPDAVDAFIKNLPKGDQYEGMIPPPSMLGNPQPPLSTEVP